MRTEHGSRMERPYGWGWAPRHVSAAHWAETLLPNDQRVPVCADADRMHAEASLRYVTGDDYMISHWLAAYAVLLFS